MAVRLVRKSKLTSAPRNLDFKPIAKTTLTESVFEKLVTSLLEGPWEAGDRIPPERELCQQLGIGRASLREALKALELIGMLECRVGDGTFVLPRSEFLSRPLLWAITGTDKAELRDIVEARKVMEGEIAALAAERATTEEADEIGAAVADLRAGIAEPVRALEADIRFHLALAKAAHNKVLFNAVQLLRNLLGQWLLLKLRMPEAPVRVLQQHEAIYTAIRHRDPSRARAEMLQHLSEMGHLLIKVVESSHHEPFVKEFRG
jgi:GntR family transcriptional regulator, transcriptional repressor for pyruvate dehydrogenase complex